VVEVPAEVVAVISTIPVPAGEVAVQEMVDAQVTLGLAVVPNLAVVEPTTKFVPVMVTTVPPPSAPAPGETALMNGPELKVNWSADEVAEVLPDAVTVMSTIPVPAGEVAVHEVVDAHETAVPAVPPNSAVVEPTTKFVPVMVTTVPPPVEPELGAIAVMAGGRVTVWEASADGPPLLDTVWPVKTSVVEVPAVSVTVKVAVNGPPVA
jgi:hypothetical protein